MEKEDLVDTWRMAVEVDGGDSLAEDFARPRLVEKEPPLVEVNVDVKEINVIDACNRYENANIKI